MVFNELHHHPCHLHKRVPHIPRSLQFSKPFSHWFLKSTHGSDVEDRSGQSLQPPPSAQNYTTTLARELYSVFTARLSVELGAAKCLQNTNKCRQRCCCYITAFFLGEKFVAFYRQVFWGLDLLKVTKLSVDGIEEALA